MDLSTALLSGVPDENLEQRMENQTILRNWMLHMYVCLRMLLSYMGGEIVKSHVKRKVSRNVMEQNLSIL